MLTSVRDRHHHWIKGRFRIATVLLCALVILAACGTDSGEGTTSDDEGRRFVTERRPTSVVAETVVPSPVAETSAPTVVPTVSPHELLTARGAPRFVYLLIDGAITVYDANSRAFSPVQLSDDMELIDFTSSPTGDRVGVLGMQEQTYMVQFFGADGQPLSDPVSLNVTPLPQLVASAVASPVATPVTSALTGLHIEWVPQGNGVLVSGPGVLKRVSMSGSVMPVSRTGATGTVVYAIWSPMDSQVVMQTQLLDGHQSVFVLNSGLDDVNEIDVLHDSSGPSITNLQWLPSGLGLVLVAGNLDDGDVMNGQLYVYRFGEPVPTLIATSGQGGPAATITHAVVSPDGHSVAYAIMVRDLDEWHLHSLWVRPVKGGPAVAIPTNTNAPITEILWSAEGLVWQQSDGTVSVVDGSIQPRLLGEAPVATPVSSPVATPIEEATPRG